MFVHFREYVHDVFILIQSKIDYRKLIIMKKKVWVVGQMSAKESTHSFFPIKSINSRLLAPHFENMLTFSSWLSLLWLFYWSNTAEEKRKKYRAKNGVTSSQSVSLRKKIAFHFAWIDEVSSCLQSFCLFLMHSQQTIKPCFCAKKSTFEPIQWNV